MTALHCLVATQFQLAPVLQPNNWITLIFCLLLFLFTVMIITFRRKLFLMFRALFFQRHFSLIQRESKVLEDRVSLLVLLFDLLTITTGLVMFCTTYISKAMSKLPFIAYIGIFFFILLMLYLIKLLSVSLYSSLYGREKERAPINQSRFIFMTDMAVLSFPFLIVIHYTGLTFLYYILIPLLTILRGVWFYRIMKINSVHGHGFQFFLYFCTLEILPWLVGLKVLLII